MKKQLNNSTNLQEIDHIKKELLLIANKADDLADKLGICMANLMGNKTIYK